MNIETPARTAHQDEERPTDPFGWVESVRGQLSRVVDDRDDHGPPFDDEEAVEFLDFLNVIAELQRVTSEWRCPRERDPSAEASRPYQWAVAARMLAEDDLWERTEERGEFVSRWERFLIKTIVRITRPYEALHDAMDAPRRLRLRRERAAEHARRRAQEGARDA